MITAFKPSKPDRPRTHCLKQDKRMKKRIPCVTDENSKRNICSYCIWKTYCHLGHKNGRRSTIGRTRPQNNMFEKNKTSTQRTLQQSNTTYCMSFITWTAHKWCLPPQTMISIPSLIWRPRGTINVSLEKCTHGNTGPYTKVNAYTRNKHNSHSQTTQRSVTLMWTLSCYYSNEHI